MTLLPILIALTVCNSKTTKAGVCVFVSVVTTEFQIFGCFNNTFKFVENEIIKGQIKNQSKTLLVLIENTSKKKLKSNLGIIDHEAD